MSHFAPAKPGEQVHSHVWRDGSDVTLAACELQSIATSHVRHVGRTWPAAQVSQSEPAKPAGHTLQSNPTQWLRQSHTHFSLLASVTTVSAWLVQCVSTEHFVHCGYATWPAAHASHVPVLKFGGHVSHSAPSHAAVQAQTQLVRVGSDPTDVALPLQFAALVHCVHVG